MATRYYIAVHVNDSLLGAFSRLDPHGTRGLRVAYWKDVKQAPKWRDKEAAQQAAVMLRGAFQGMGYAFEVNEIEV